MLESSSKTPTTTTEGSSGCNCVEAIDGYIGCEYLRTCCCYKDSVNGFVMCSTYCGEDQWCTDDGCSTCMLSPGGRIWISVALVSSYVLFGGVTFMALEPSVFRTLSISTYFSVITITTIGYGDFVPETVGGMAWAFFYAHVGIVMFGTASTFLSHEMLNCCCLEPEENKKKCRHLRLSLAIFISYIIILLLGSGIFIAICETQLVIISNRNITTDAVEPWSFPEAFFFSWVTATTVGYGNSTLKGVLGRFFVAMFSVFGMVMVSLLFSHLSAIRKSAEKLILRKRYNQQEDKQPYHHLIDKVTKIGQFYDKLSTDEKVIFFKMLSDLGVEKRKELVSSDSIDSSGTTSVAASSLNT